MKKFSAVVLLLFGLKSITAQVPDWSTSVAEIIYENCSGCHRPGGIGPFELLSYDDAVYNAFSIQANVNAGKMPPWPPDVNYSHFQNENVLSPADIATINNWIDGGMPAGDMGLAPDPPVFTGASLMAQIDDTIEVPSYTILSDEDEFRSFVVHSNYTETMYLNQVEFIPDDYSAVHHVFLFHDSSDISYEEDMLDTLPGFHEGGFGIVSPYSELVGGWVPGAGIIKLPSNMGFQVMPGADFVVAFHYAPGSMGKTVSMKINLKFSNDPNPREVEDRRILYWKPPVLLNPPFEIPANQVVTFYEMNSMEANKSLVAIQPHMHLLGKSFKVYMVTQPGDTTNLLWIPQWDFAWQMDYFLTKLIKIPAYAQIIGEGVYDNTTNNPDNPNNPPIDVFSGEGTSDEMMGCHFSILDYEPGDEYIILDSSANIPTSASDGSTGSLALNVFPNPAESVLRFAATLPENEIHYTLFNELGMVEWQSNETGIHKGIYLKELNISRLPNGIYFLRVRSGSFESATKVLVQKGMR